MQSYKVNNWEMKDFQNGGTGFGAVERSDCGNYSSVHFINETTQLR